MTRYIDADKFIDWLDVGHLRSPSEVCLSELNVKRMIEQQPTADVREVKHGEWLSAYEHALRIGLNDELLERSKQDKWWKFCPFCEQSVKGFFNFCPSCGADMRKESE